MAVTTQTSNFGIGVTPLDYNWRASDGVRWMLREVPDGVAAIQIDDSTQDWEIIVRWKTSSGEIHDCRFAYGTPQYEIRDTALAAMKLTC